MKNVQVKDFLIGKGQPLTFVTGPCVIENEAHTLRCAEAICKMFEGKKANVIFKACYDKANRTSIHSFRGPGIEEGLRILQKVKENFDVPVISDIHTPDEAPIAANVLDVVQIPAFLCRQTDLIVAAAKTGKPLLIKKGQFVAPWDMENVVHKAQECGNEQIILADRGTCFGYNMLISDMRAIPIMQQLGYPVCFDASHSVQRPGGQKSSSGGDRQYIPTLARAAVAAGCDVVFIESHPNPAEAKSDGPIVYPLDQLEALVDALISIHEVVQPLL